MAGLKATSATVLYSVVADTSRTINTTPTPKASNNHATVRAK